MIFFLGIYWFTAKGAPSTRKDGTCFEFCRRKIRPDRSPTKRSSSWRSRSSRWSLICWHLSLSSRPVSSRKAPSSLWHLNWNPERRQSTALGVSRPLFLCGHLGSVTQVANWISIKFIRSWKVVSGPLERRGACVMDVGAALQFRHSWILHVVPFVPYLFLSAMETAPLLRFYGGRRLWDAARHRCRHAHLRRLA